MLGVAKSSTDRAHVETISLDLTMRTLRLRKLKPCGVDHT